MRLYLITTAALFLLVTGAHLFRFRAEPDLLRDPWYLAITVAALALGVWAVLLLRRTRGVAARDR